MKSNPFKKIEPTAGPLSQVAPEELGKRILANLNRVNVV